MHLVSEQGGAPIGSPSELVDYFVAAGKPRAQWRVGTEHEMIGVHRDGGALPYFGDRGIASILEALQAFGWAPVREDGNVIALTRGLTQITIEPGGQFEHAAAPVAGSVEFAEELRKFISEVCSPTVSRGISWLALGFRPFGTLDEVPWMPKQRYAIMRDYLPQKGRLAHEMMKRTATVQTNLDFANMEDARSKFRCAMSVSSIMTALYANSPIVDGRPSQYQSYRAEIWRYTDPDRCGLLPFVFEDGDFFAEYTDWALNVPMFFVHRGHYRSVGGMTFAQFLRDGFEGARATIADWELHLSTLFPEARLKKYIELRACDAGAMDMTIALGALSRGLLYDEHACQAATALTEMLTFDQRLQLAQQVPQSGLKTRVPGSTATVADLAKELVEIAVDGLRRVGPADEPHLQPLLAIAESQRTRADEVLDIWSRHQGYVETLIAKLSYPEFGKC